MEKAAPDEKAQTQLAAAAAANSSSSAGQRPNGSPTAHSLPAAASSSSSFELCLSSFRHLSLTLSSNLELLAAKMEEQLSRPFGLQQQRHQRETRRVADEIARLNKQLQSLQDGLQHSKVSAKKACLELQLWLMEQRERAGRAAAGGASHTASDGLPSFGGGVDSHTVFDELVSSFRWDADSMKKRALSVDGRYVQAVKALRSYWPEHDRQLRQLMADAQREEEERRREQLRVVSSYCELHTAMYDKCLRSLRSVSAMSAQVNSRREMRQWMRAHRGEGRHEPLPEYVMHKGHPRYDETQEVEEPHEHEGLTDEDDSDAAAGDDNEEEEEEEEAEDEPADEDEDDERESSAQGRRRRHRARVAHRKGGDELDEREDEKTEERIVAEKVLRVFINKAVGNRQTAAEAARDGDEQAAAAAAMDLSAPTSPTLTSPLPRTAFMPVQPEQLGDGSALDEDEEQAAKAIFSTRDGRNAFAACFSSLSPTFYSSQLPLSLFSTFSQPPSPSAAQRASAPPSPPAASLTLSAVSFAALSSLTVLFLDATVGSSHIEPAVFVANVAHQILRARDAQQKQSSAQPAAAGSASSAAADDVMRKEQLEGGEEAEPALTLLSHLSSHPLFAEAQRFFSSALFASLHHHFAHQSLYIHRWHSDAEQEAVMRGRRALTLRLLRDYSQLMRHCGVKRKERRRFVEKQIRVFDLLAADDAKEEVAALRRLNERHSAAAAGGQETVDESEDESSSPLAIDGLREQGSEVDSEEERKQELLRRKERERRLMSEEKKKRRRVRVNEHGAYEQTAAGRPDDGDKQRAKRKEEEQREQERRRAEEEERSRGKKTGFFASLFGRTSPSPSSSPSLAPEHQRSIAGQAVAAPAVTAAKAETATTTSGVRIPIPVAAAVPPPVAAAVSAPASAAASRKLEPSASAAGKTAAASVAPVGKKQTNTGAAEATSVSAAAADNVATKRARVVKKRAVRKPAAEAAAAPLLPQKAAAAGDAATEEQKVASAEPAAQSSSASALQQSADSVQTATSTDDMP